MSYSKTLEYLFSRLPMYQREGISAYKPDFKNTLEICKLLGNPEKKLRCIHVAGTNGKGSSSHMLAAILQKSGYKTGLYTSPHLTDFRERIKINGKPISKKYVEEFVEKHKENFEKIEPSFFEWTVGLAFDYFRNEEVDVAVIEVGLGGRLDSTNVITPEACLITNISFDHMNILGDTLPLIAAEKAGIIKARVPVVVSQYQPEVGPIFANKARELKSPIEFSEKVYKVLDSKSEKGLQLITILNKKTNQHIQLELDLQGSYQTKNVLGVLSLIEILRDKGFLIEDSDVHKALKNVAATTDLRGRWQIVQEKPYVIVDTGHNEDGIKEVLETIKRYSYKKLHIVFGVVADKDSTKILKLLPKEATYYFCKASIPRALNEKDLLEQAKKCGLVGKSYIDVPSALAAAKKQAKVSDLILVGGSTFVVADAFS